MQRTVAVIVVLCLAGAVVSACAGGHASQAKTARSSGESDVAASAFLLRQYADGKASPQFTKASLRQYLAALEQDRSSLEDLTPPAQDRDRQQQARDAVQQAEQMVRQVLDQGLNRAAAGDIADKLDSLTGALGES